MKWCPGPTSAGLTAHVPGEPGVPGGHGPHGAEGPEPGAQGAPDGGRVALSALAASKAIHREPKMLELRAKLVPRVRGPLCGP